MRMLADVPELERLPGAAGIKVFMGSSTGDLLVEDDEGVAEILKRTRRRAAFHSEDETMLRERMGLRVDGRPVEPSGLARRRGGADLHEAAGARSRARPGRACISCTSRPGTRCVFLKDHKDVATVEVLPNHLTLVAPDCYERLGTYAQMNPPIRDDSHRAAHLVGRGAGHRRRARFRSRAAYA